MLSDIALLTGSISDLNWFRDNSEKLEEQYEGEIVAIKDKNIVAFAPTVDILFRKLEEKGVKQEEVLIKYISPSNQIVIL